MPVVADVVSENHSGRPLQVAQLSDEASRFIGTLRELGYLDDALEDEVLDLLMAELPPQEAGLKLPNIELDDLRPHVATVLFDRQQELDAAQARSRTCTLVTCPPGLSSFILCTCACAGLRTCRQADARMDPCYRAHRHTCTRTCAGAYAYGHVCRRQNSVYLIKLVIWW